MSLREKSGLVPDFDGCTKTELRAWIRQVNGEQSTKIY